ncbi:MAG: HAMP domain-containing protein [Desulfobacteraceae bacterium]|nr:HAMP domain-containing protein [Desulfobacteraceae bacterium]MCF8094546.1 HAMP domain-containing protein [Desulfobacteraceae bacterium]
MRFKSLRTGIFINLAFLLFFAIALTDLVLLQITEQRMVEDRIDAARKKIKAIDVVGDAAEQNSREFALVAKHGSISAALISIDGREPELFGKFPESHANEVYRFHDRVLVGRDSRLQLVGTSWGVFWPRNRYAVISEPLSGKRSAVTAVVPLAPVYRSMRDVQHMAVFYLLINLLLLLSFGGWRMSRKLTRPINRLIGITDEYRANEGFDMFPERRDDEFSRLSGALNQMVRRIEADRDQLRSSLESLEQSNRQLKAAQKEIVRAEKLASTGRLSAGLAHEIGNPIGIVLGYLGLLKSRSISPDDQVAMDYIERAEAEIQRVNTIIQQLLDFSRSRSADFSVLSVHELVKYAGEMLSQQPLFSGVRIGYTLEAEDDRIYGDSDHLHQVMVNLMINSADSIKQSHNADNGLIRLVTRTMDNQSEEGGKRLELKVVDNGAGIDEQHMDKIFDPFFTTKETGKGTGLGLSVSYMIIEQMGGDIDVRLPEAGGTEIIIRLPVAEESHNDKGRHGKNNRGGITS